MKNTCGTRAAQQRGQRAAGDSAAALSRRSPVNKPCELRSVVADARPSGWLCLTILHGGFLHVGDITQQSSSHMNPRRVHELMRKHFQEHSPGSEWINVADRNGAMPGRIEALLNTHIRVADRNFTSFVEIAVNGVARGGSIPH